MEATPRDERISLSCYASDLRTLRKLLVELGKREVRVKRTFLIRALTHTTPEPEILARTILHQKVERPLKGRGNEGGAHTEERLTLHLLKDDLKKLDRVSDELLAKDLEVTRTYILRALVQSVSDFDALAKDVKGFMAEFPDLRRVEARKKR